MKIQMFLILRGYIFATQTCFNIKKVRNLYYLRTAGYLPDCNWRCSSGSDVRGPRPSGNDGDVAVGSDRVAPRRRRDGRGPRGGYGGGGGKRDGDATRAAHVRRPAAETPFDGTSKSRESLSSLEKLHEFRVRQTATYRLKHDIHSTFPPNTTFQRYM